MQKINIALTTLATALLGTAATAAVSGYSSELFSAPTIFQTNVVVRGGTWPVVGQPRSTSKITTVSWRVGYGTPTTGTLLVRVCNDKAISTKCTAWGANSGQTTIFSGTNANTNFYFQATVQGPRTVVLSRPLQASGRSSLSVNYNI